MLYTRPARRASLTTSLSMTSAVERSEVPGTRFGERVSSSDSVVAFSVPRGRRPLHNRGSTLTAPLYVPLLVKGKHGALFGELYVPRICGL
jgi:hypothetical protein